MDDFFDTSCRVCLEASDTMLNTDEKIHKFNKTINELLIECVNFEVSKSSAYPKLICKECASILLVVADFHEKCKRTEKILEHWRSKGHYLAKSIPENFNFEEADDEEDDIEEDMVEKESEEHIVDSTDAYVDSTSDLVANEKSFKQETVYEDIEYVQGIENDEQVEYVIIQNTEDDLENLFLQVNVDDAYVVQEQDCDDEAMEDSETNENDSEKLSSSGKKDKRESNKLPNEIPKKTASTALKASRKGERNEFKQTVINYRCEVCGAGFTHLNNLVRHHKTHREVKSNDPTYSIIDTSEENCRGTQEAGNKEEGNKKDRNKRPDTDKRKLDKDYACQYCKKAFISPSLLSAHIRIHTGERPFKCETCPKAFKTQGALDLHSRRHSGYKPYKCTVCNRGFVESSNLKVHMRTHTGEKPHQCTICDRSFSRVFLLQLHQRTHTGERPYSCDHCRKSFAQQCDLTAHKRIHTGERPHICKVCSKGFIKGSALTQHMRRHSRPKNKKAKLLNEDEQETIEAEISEDVGDEQIIICYESTSEI